MTELAVLVVRKHPAAAVVRVSQLVTAVLAVLDPVTDLVQLNAGPAVTSPLAATGRPAGSAAPRVGGLLQEMMRNANCPVSLAPGVFLPQVAGAVLTGEQVAAKISFSALIASVQAVFSPVTDIAGINTEAVPAPPAPSYVQTFAFPGWRVGTLLTGLPLLLLLLAVALAVPGAVEDSPGVPGPAPGLVVKVEKVAALAGPQTLVITVVAVPPSVTDLLLRQCLVISLALPAWKLFSN